MTTSQSVMNQCCVEKGICMRICGMDWNKCTKMFEKCATDKCGDNLECWAVADAVEILVQGGDHAFGVCKAHRESLLGLCDCVPWKSAKDGASNRLASFYRVFSPERLDDNGDVRDIDAVWKKWKGREPELYFELTRKYSAQALEIRAWPENDVAKWKAKEELDRLAGEQHAAALHKIEEERTLAEKRFADEQELARHQREEKLTRQKAEREEAARLRQLADDEKARKRAEDKLARRAAEQQRHETVQRLRAEKDAAVAAENFMLAKALKEQIDNALIVDVLETRKEEL